MKCAIRGIGFIAMGLIVAVTVVNAIVYPERQQDLVPSKEKRDAVPSKKKQGRVSPEEKKDLNLQWPCLDGSIEGSGVHRFRGNNEFDVVDAYCEQQSYGGVWMVIQHRFDGSLSFNQNWTLYRKGFGDAGGEHWLGLEKVYQLTKKWNCELLVEMKDFHNNYAHAWYKSFRIGGENEQYRLKTLETYSGTAGDALSSHIGIVFSTHDRDNEREDGDNDGTCTRNLKAGWWVRNCAEAVLNGPYRNAQGADVDSIIWNNFGKDERGLSFTRMMIRPVRSD